MKTPDELTARLKDVLKENLVAVTLYGSAAAGDRTARYSDYNILVVVRDMDLPVLKALMPVTAKWTKAGNPPPLLFTEDRLRRAGDVFPLEFLDIRDTHRVLYGGDPFAGLAVDTAHLRHQLEYELRGKLLQFRERFLETGGKPRLIRDLAARSISTFATLFKGVLRLEGRRAPAKRGEAVDALAAVVPIDAGACHTALALRNKDKAALNADPETLFQRLLASVEAVVDHVDRFGHTSGGTK